MSQPLLSLNQVLRQPRKVVRQSFRQPWKTLLATFRPRSAPHPSTGQAVDPRDLPPIFTRLPVSYHETAVGNYYLPLSAPKDVVAGEMRAGRIFEPHILETARCYAQPGTSILDIGANFGQMSTLFSQLVGEKGIVYSFEAQEYCFAILKLNIAANKCDNVRPFHGAVMEKGGSEVFFPEPDFVRFGSYGSYPLSLNGDENARAAVKTVAIDDIAFERPISFCKIDVQGSDIFVLRGMRETIRKHRMPILFEYEERFQEEFDFVQSIDYRFVKTVAEINYLIMPAGNRNPEGHARSHA
jgi:FkbM family methyltransferase